MMFLKAENSFKFPLEPNNCNFFQDEIFSSSFAAAMFLKVNDFPQEKKVGVSLH